MSFDAEARRAARAQFTHLGRAALYLPHEEGATPIPTIVILLPDVEQYPDAAVRAMTGKIPAAVVKLEDLPRVPERDDRFTFTEEGTESYRVDGELENDGFVSTIRVRKVTGS